jgi:uncharacterized protein (DUF2236 family)
MSVSRADAVRRFVRDEVRTRVVGPDPEAARAAIWDVPGPRRYGPTDPIWAVHSDASMFVGGLRALLLQSVHPLAMQGVADHSDYRRDPWGRLQRTSAFLAATTFGTDEVAADAVARVRNAHRRVRGTAPNGTRYSANDPHLLAWVHAAEIDSFLRAFERYGAATLTDDQRDTYVAQAAETAAALGVIDPPRSRHELRETLLAYRPELTPIPAARDAARFLVFSPPLPLVARPAYGLLVAGAVELLPGWVRRMLRLPPTRALAPVTRAACGAAVTTVRWAMTADA